MCPLPSVKILRAKNDIVADVEVIPHPEVNEGCERMLKGDVKCRFVIDTASLKLLW